MLSGTLPFDSEDDKEIARKTIYDEVNLQHKVWTTISDEAKDIVLRLLVKNRKNRMTLLEVLEHPWIMKHNKNLLQLRRKSSDEGNKLMQFLAYANTDDKEESK